MHQIYQKYLLTHYEYLIIKQTANKILIYFEKKNHVKNYNDRQIIVQFIIQVVYFFNDHR